MINSELLKEAIADAKAVRATALANATAALKESFTPRVEAYFAEKLKEEAEVEDEEEMNEVEAPNQVSGKGGEAKGPATKAVTKGNPKQPKGGSGDTSFKPVKAGKGPSDVANFAKKVNETSEEDEGKDSIDEAGLTSEDLDEIIAELEHEVSDEEQGQKPAPQIPGEEVPGEEMQGQEIPGDDVNVEQPEADVQAEPGSEVDIDLGQGQPGEEEVGAEELPQGMNAGGEEAGEEAGAAPAPAPFPPKAEDDENINLEELLAALNEAADEEEEEKVDEAVSNGVPTSDLKGQDAKGGVKGYPKTVSNKDIEASGKNHNIGGKGNIGTGATGGKPTSESVQYKKALKEAYSTIEYLRGQINEVNLLNAKLLYTNKLFKEFAGVLDDKYRLTIIENFDLTKDVREVKLAYAILAESLNFGTQFTRSQKVGTGKPATAVKTQVKQITEGFASKPVSSTKPAGIITEGNEMALRFKKLAGIKEAPKVISNKK